MSIEIESIEPVLTETAPYELRSGEEFRLIEGVDFIPSNRFRTEERTHFEFDLDSNQFATSQEQVIPSRKNNDWIG